MNKFLNVVNHSIRSFAKDEDGAQIIEYALIVAVVSLGLILAMKGLVDTDFSSWISRVATCLGTGPCV